MIQKEIKAWALKLVCAKEDADDADFLFCGEYDGEAMFSSIKTPVYFTTEKIARDYLKSHITTQNHQNVLVRSVMLRKHKPLTVAESNFLSCAILLDENSIPHDFTAEAEELKQRNYRWFCDFVMKRALK